VVWVRQVIANLSLQRYGLDTRPVRMVTGKQCVNGTSCFRIGRFPPVNIIPQRSILIRSSVIINNLRSWQHRQKKKEIGCQSQYRIQLAWWSAIYNWREHNHENFTFEVKASDSRFSWKPVFVKKPASEDKVFPVLISHDTKNVRCVQVLFLRWEPTLSSR
jgi:hypothetical protein